MTTLFSRCRFTRMTPVGRGAIAVVLVEGKEATELVDAVFQSAAGKPLNAFPQGRIVFGTWANGEELVVCRTGEQAVEVHCHGGDAAFQSVAASLESLGCQRIESSKTPPDGAVAERAWSILPQAPTERIAGILLNQYRGALNAAIEAIVADLQSEQIESASAQLAELVRRASVGLHLLEPWRVAIVGETNVGKSSLMNRFVGFERSITFDEPGVTRDLVTADSAIDGWPVRFTDTAGIRDAQNASEIESIGMQLSREELRSADIVIVVLDARHAVVPQLQALGAIPSDAIIVVNKSDLAETLPADRSADSISVCAITGVGVDVLLREVARRIAGEEVDWLASQTAVPFLPEQCVLLRRCQELIAEGSIGEAVQRMQPLVAN